MTPCEQQLRHRMAAAGAWVLATELRQGLPFSEAVLDDVLSDMVIRGDILFNARTLQYRLAVGPAARLAVQRLVRDDQPRAMVGRQARDGSYLVGLARREGDAVVCAEVAFDYPGAEVLEQLQPAVLAWLGQADEV
jgi:hypothetical protein